jgi:hypothetical protein
MRIRIKKIAENPGGAEARSMKDHVPGGPNDDGKSLPVEYEIEGELLWPIRPGESVFVLRDKRNGETVPGAFVSSPVTEVSSNGFRTKNSVYITG